MEHLQHVLVNGNPTLTRINEPFPMWILDNFFKPEIPTRINTEWPDIDDPRWHHGITEVSGKKSVLEGKLRFIDKPEKYTPAAAEVMTFFYSPEFMSYLSHLTGIEGLFPDHTYRWSGMRTSYPGSFQLIHRDAQKHPENGFCRKLTVLYYLNEGYRKETHGGCLEVWDKSMTTRMHEIQPICNRLLVFLCTEHSYHGVPEILQERRFLMSSAMTTEKTAESVRARFVARPQDSEEVRKQGDERSHY